MPSDEVTFDDHATVAAFSPEEVAELTEALGHEPSGAELLEWRRRGNGVSRHWEDDGGAVHDCKE